MDASSAAHVLDLVLPHALTGALLTVIIPALLYLVGFRFQWRKDRREQDDSVGGLMKRLADAQGAELFRLMTEGEMLRGQIRILSDGRFRLQDCLDTLREEVIAARVLIHDYERRLGLPETAFPPLQTILLLERPKQP